MSRAHSASPTLISSALLRKWPLPQIRPLLGKDARGAVLVVGGSTQIPGAVILAATGALRAGAGKLQIATARSVTAAVGVSVPEARVIGLAESRAGELRRGCHESLLHELEAANAVLVGPGMSDPKAAVDVLRHCIAKHTRASLIVDAAALHAFDGRKPIRRKAALALIATPHAGEMASLWGCTREEVIERPLEIARDAAAALGVVVALKGAQTLVVAPDGTAYRNTAGNLGLGTSGSGDTLSGVIAGLCARGASALQAAVWGVFLHARAGDMLARRIGPLGFLARELLDEIPALLQKAGR